MKKYDFSMKKYDFFALHRAVEGKKTPSFLQDFCKNAQWRAKKLRERGSSTARPTEKGVGGLPIGSRFGRFGASIRSISVVSRRDLRTSSWRFVLIRSRFGRFRSRFGVLVVPVVPIRSISARRSIRSRRNPMRKHKKKPDSSIGESGSAIARRRALEAFG